MYNIGIFTSSRSDYGILSNIIKKLNENINVRLKIFVAGSHLSKVYGYTVNEIKKDINSELIYCPNIIFNKHKIDMAASSNKLISIFKKKLDRSKIKTIIFLGDRYEILPAALICLLKGVKIVHIHGGEITEGAIDNYIRNAMSMISNYHFVATPKSKKRLLNFGIDKKRVFLIGAPGLEDINKYLFNREFLEKKFNFKFYKQNIMISYHPETLDLENVNKNLNILLSSIKKFKKVRLIFSAPGADLKSDFIKRKIKDFSNKNKNSIYFDSFGHKDYLSFLKICNLLVGNSSSGIIEAPSLNTLSINLGIRQRGREKAKSVKDLSFSKNLIVKTIKKVINGKETRKKIKNPYYVYKNPSSKFVKILLKNLKKRN